MFIFFTRRRIQTPISGPYLKPQGWNDFVETRFVPGDAIKTNIFQRCRAKFSFKGSRTRSKKVFRVSGLTSFRKVPRNPKSNLTPFADIRQQRGFAVSVDFFFLLPCLPSSPHHPSLPCKGKRFLSKRRLHNYKGKFD